MVELIAFPEANDPPASLEELVDRVQALALKSENVFFNTPHVKVRMKERNVTIRQILDVLRHGKGIDGPILDKYGDWRIKMKRYTAGRSVKVVVVVKKYLEVVTVI